MSKLGLIIKIATILKKGINTDKIVDSYNSSSNKTENIEVMIALIRTLIIIAIPDKELILLTSMTQVKRYTWSIQCLETLCSDILP